MSSNGFGGVSRTVQWCCLARLCVLWTNGQHNYVDHASTVYIPFCRQLVSQSALSQCWNVRIKSTRRPRARWATCWLKNWNHQRPWAIVATDNMHVIIWSWSWDDEHHHHILPSTRKFSNHSQPTSSWHAFTVCCGEEPTTTVSTIPSTLSGIQATCKTNQFQKKRDSHQGQ